MGFSCLLLIGLDPLIDFVPASALVADGGLYEAGLLAADGKTGIDTAWLREQLDMPGDLAD